MIAVLAVIGVLAAGAAAALSVDGGVIQAFTIDVDLETPAPEAPEKCDGMTFDEVFV